MKIIATLISIVTVLSLCSTMPVSNAVIADTNTTLQSISQTSTFTESDKIGNIEYLTSSEDATYGTVDSGESIVR